MKVNCSETTACVQATAQVRRRLAELELDMDRQQGWVRGGSKAEVKLLACLLPEPRAITRVKLLSIQFGPVFVRTADTVLSWHPSKESD